MRDDGVQTLRVALVPGDRGLAQALEPQQMLSQQILTVFLAGIDQTPLHSLSRADGLRVQCHVVRPGESDPAHEEWQDQRGQYPEEQFRQTELRLLFAQY